jgi:hypothetical protein
VTDDPFEIARLRTEAGWERLHLDSRFRAEMRLCNKMGIPHSQFMSWDVDDQEKALQYDAWIGMLCPGCSTHPEMWERDQYALVGDTHMCHGCREIENARQDIPETATSTYAILRPMTAEERGDDG